MYNSVETANRIRDLAKENNLAIATILEKCSLNKNTLSTMSTRGSWIQSNSLGLIADCLDCSVDYLLGRTEEKKVSSDLSDFEQRLINIYRSLSHQGQEYLQQTADMAALKYKKATLSTDIKKTAN